MIGWLARLRRRLRELRWWLVAADSLRQGNLEHRVKLGSMLATVLGLQFIQARIRKLRRGLGVADALRRGDIESVLRQHFMGRLIGVRLYRRLRRWVAARHSRWTAVRWRA